MPVIRFGTADRPAWYHPERRDRDEAALGRRVEVDTAIVNAGLQPEGHRSAQPFAR